MAPMGDGAAVLLQQRFGSLVAGYDGLLVIGVRDGMVFHVSGSLARDAAESAPARLSAEDALPPTASPSSPSPSRPFQTPQN